MCAAVCAVKIDWCAIFLRMSRFGYFVKMKVFWSGDWFVVGEIVVLWFGLR